LGRSYAYPWDLWLNGDSHVLRKGRDYTIDTLSMRRQVKRRAAGIGKRADTYRNWYRGREQLSIQVVEKDAPRKLKIKRQTGIPTVPELTATRINTIAKRKGVDAGAVVEVAVNLWWDQLGYKDDH
jgi:hypothetical protein